MTRTEALQSLSRPVFGDEHQIAAVSLLSRAERWEAGERMEPWEVDGELMAAVLGRAAAGEAVDDEEVAEVLEVIRG